MNIVGIFPKNELIILEIYDKKSQIPAYNSKSAESFKFALGL